MPTLAVHLAVVEEASAVVRNDILSQHLGDLYLGATSPDIRNLLGLPREDTHYIGLAESGGRCGIGCFLQSHQALSDLKNLSDSAKAFVAGYLSHLMVDGTWIVEIYRPYFGKDSEWAELPESGMLDRALQFELEERERHNLSDLDAVSQIIGQAEGFAGLGVADDDDLRRWREFIVQAIEIADVRERFRYFASSFTRQGRIMANTRINGFVVAFPALAARALQHVSEASLASFRQKSIAASVDVIRDYLSGDFPVLLKL